MKKTASKKWGKAQTCVQEAIDKGIIRAGTTNDSPEMGISTAKAICGDSDFLSDFPDAYWLCNYGDPNGGCYKEGLILFPCIGHGEEIETAPITR